MNINNINRLADVIEVQEHTNREAASGFAMNVFFHTCGTPACIAGWADYLSGAEWYGDARTDEVEERAAEWLDLESDQAYSLFWAGNLDLRLITPKQAAAVLRHLAVTGNVDWSVGVPV